MRTMFYRGLVLFGYPVHVGDGIAWKSAKKMIKEMIACAPYRVIRRILLISTYSLISAYCSAVINTRC